jgi:hypothetical protein
MYSRKTARAIRFAGAVMSPRGLDRLRPGSFRFSLESGEGIRGGHGFGLDQTLERKQDSSPSEIECRTRRIVSR